MNTKGDTPYLRNIHWSVQKWIAKGKTAKETSKNCLTKNETEALKELSLIDNHIFTKADRDDAVVIVNEVIPVKLTNK